MSGVFPDGGVTANNTANGTEVESSNCPAELFYSTARCNPRFEPAAMNALISEILNVMNCAGHTYNCNDLTNLCQAIRKLNGGNDATPGDTIYPGNLITSTDNVLMWNCTDADIVVGETATAEALAAQGFCYVSARAEEVTAGGTDSFGNTISSGDEVITFSDGTRLVVTAGGGTGGGQNGGTDTNGTFEEATSTEIRDGTGAGGTGARLAMNPARMVAVADFPAGQNVQRDQDHIWMRDASTNRMYWMPLDRLPVTANPVNTPGNWVVDINGGSGVWPAGPTPDGIWEITWASSPTNPGAGAPNWGIDPAFGQGLPGDTNRQRIGFARVGAPYNLNAQGGGETDGRMVGIWRPA